MPWFINATTEVHLDCFQYLKIIYGVVKNIYIQIFLCEHVFIFLEKLSRSQVSRIYTK